VRKRWVQASWRLTSRHRLSETVRVRRIDPEFVDPPESGRWKIKGIQAAPVQSHLALNLAIARAL